METFTAQQKTNIDFALTEKYLGIKTVLLNLWKESEENPLLMDNLARMTKVAMANVDFNKKDAIWIGSSLAFF